MRVIGLLVVVSLWLGAECTDATSQKFERIMSSREYNVPLLQKLYQGCESQIIEAVLFFAKAKEYQNRKLHKSAKQNYWKALSLIENNNLTELNELKKSIEDEIFNYQQEEPLDSKTLDNRGYIRPRGGVQLRSRDARLKHFNQLKGIPLNFKTDQSKIKGKTLKQAKAIGELLSKKYSKKKIYIAGFTDTRGRYSHNENLSSKRAESLKNYLVKKYKFKSSNIIVDSYGESLPICINGTKVRRGRDYKCTGKENYFKSRRVTIEIGE